MIRRLAAVLFVLALTFRPDFAQPETARPTDLTGRPDKATAIEAVAPYVIQSALCATSLGEPMRAGRASDPHPVGRAADVSRTTTA
jgi:hypothetical protein